MPFTMIKNEGQGMGLGLGGDDDFSYRVVPEASVSFCSEYIESEVDVQ